MSEKKSRKVYKVTQKVFLYNPDDKKFLLLRIADTEGQFFKKYGPWDAVGGHIDEGDDIDASVQREIIEEAGENVQYEIDSVLDRIEVEYGSGDRMMIGILALYKGGEIKISDEHTEYKWLSAEEMEKSVEIKPWIKEFVKLASERLKANEYLTDLKRCQADFENYKRRQQESQKELGGYLIEKLVLDIIPVLDNFRSATMHVPVEQKESPWVVGIQYIEKQLETVLTDNGMQTIEAKEGDEFDPKLHEAVDYEKTQETSDKEQDEEPAVHTIAKVIQKGYRLGDKVIRAARVIVK